MSLKSFFVQRQNDPFLEAIASRLRAIVGRQRGYALETVADLLEVPAPAFQSLIDGSGRAIDPALLIDVVAGFVREFAVDPQWLLTGQYDGALHRQALLLGEDRSSNGKQQLRDFVRFEYLRLRTSSSDFGLADSPRAEL